jgi:hypothetical protein
LKLFREVLKGSKQLYSQQHPTFFKLESAMVSTEAALAIAAAVILNVCSLTVMYQMWQKRDDMMVSNTHFATVRMLLHASAALMVVITAATSDEALHRRC